METFLFDFDNTLADSGETSIMAVQKVFADAHKPVPSREMIFSDMGLPIETSFPVWAGLDSQDIFLQQMYAEFRAYYSEIEGANTRLFPGIQAALEGLKNNGHKLYVVSSKSSGPLARNLDNLGIGQYFTDLVGSDLVENFKPAPDGILQLVEKYRLNKEQAVMVGDAIFDLQMGHAAGVKTAGAGWGAFDLEALKAQKPTYLLDEPAQLLEIK
ncbi:phosphoglycolate phosphatase haloacid dehalogenase hydrolase [Ligilactobacillus salitolerans]|uniref:Phosphoglycolate phosphatase haloacid dehalogenase hydrolase n=2 Tax=Ligilactobacillus salitolerans TaxID=1808352 RepID=A0A401ITE6_9LACO|nr:phosphoglycolate phosphatase haloacid dehalogenase hydrolase [Ligilactobacillus salitolerans]